MKQLRLSLLAVLTLAAATPVLAQRGGHPPGGPPGGGPPADRGTGASHGSTTPDGNSATGHADMMRAAPGDVLSHNTAIAGKIKALTGEDAAKACGGFKNLGQCVAAAHIAKNLDIRGGFAAVKAKTTGSGAVSLGKAIQELAPTANAKSESRKANKQAEEDLKESGS